MAVKNNAFWKVKQHLPDGIELSQKIKLKLSVAACFIKSRAIILCFWQQRPLVALLGQRIYFHAGGQYFPTLDEKGGKKVSSGFQVYTRRRFQLRACHVLSWAEKRVCHKNNIKALVSFKGRQLY